MTSDDDCRLGEGWRTNTGRLPLGVPRCQFPGCDRMHAARGWCDGHYGQWRQGAVLTPLEPVFPEDRPSCAVPHCQQPVARQGLCPQHWHRWRNTGAVDGERPTPPDTITAADVHAMLQRRADDARLPSLPRCPEQDPENVWAREVNAAFHARWAALDAASDALERRAAS
jgi:hypothetical protein